MHLPPAASYPVRRSRWHGALLLVVVAMGWLAVIGFWVAQSSVLRTAAIAGAAMVGTATAVWVWRASPQGVLQWDGTRWLWPGFGGAGVRRLDLVVDLQWLLLVHLHGEQGRTVHLFLVQRDSGSEWLALRRAALVRPATLESVDNGETVAAKSW